MMYGFVYSIFLRYMVSNVIFLMIGIFEVLGKRGIFEYSFVRIYFRDYRLIFVLKGSLNKI